MLQKLMKTLRVFIINIAFSFIIYIGIKPLVVDQTDVAYRQ